MTRSLAHNILGAAIDAGIGVEVDGDCNLRLSGPEDVLTPDVIAFIAAHKQAIVALLLRYAMPSHVPGVLWHPRGGVVLEERIWLERFDPRDPEGSRALLDDQADVDEAERQAELRRELLGWSARRQYLNGEEHAD